MRRICIFIILLFAVFTACQPTPGEPFVIGKDNEQMIEKAKETVGPAETSGDLYEALGAPRTYVLDLRNDAARVHIQGEAKVIKIITLVVIFIFLSNASVT